MTTSIAVIGGGGWGTALAITMARVHEGVGRWTFESDLAESRSRDRKNPISRE